MNRDEILRSSYHECGHALVGFLQGLTVHSVKVGVDGNRVGSCVVRSPVRYSKEDGSSCISRLLHTVAGPMAESIAFGNGELRDNDLKHALEALDGFTPAEQVEYIRWGEKWCRFELQKFRGLLDRMAYRLAEKGELSGPEAMELLGGRHAAA